MYVRSLVSLLVAVTLTACSGGGGAVAPAKTVLAGTPPRANVTMHITWPTRATHASDRKAEYVSTGADHITITNLQYYGTVAPPDATVRIPYGTQTATLPAYAGVNYYNVQEWPTPSESGSPLASASPYLYVYDPGGLYTLDVVLQLNLGTMGMQMLTDAPSTVVYSITNLPPGGGHPNGLASLYTAQPGAFHVFIAALDAASQVASGPGTPALTLSSNDGRITVTRTTNTYTPPSIYAGLAQYTILLTSPIGNTDHGYVSANYLNASSIPISIGRFDFHATAL